MRLSPHQVCEQWVLAAYVAQLTIVSDVRHFTAKTFRIDSVWCQRYDNSSWRKEFPTHQQVIWQMMCRSMAYCCQGVTEM